MSFYYSCTHADPVTGFRCRENAVKGTFNCPSHQKTDSPAPEPSTVLVKFFMNERRFTELEWLAREMRSIGSSRQHQQVQHRLAEAERLGVSASPVAGRVDSGTPVFGKDGLSFASPFGLAEELAGWTYVLTDVELVKKDGVKPKFYLQLQFVPKGSPIRLSVRGEEAIFKMFASVYQFIHVWVNARKGDGTVVHTVNITGLQQGQKAHCFLNFSEGMWAVTQMASAQAAE